MNPDLENLLDLAEAATPGPWDIVKEDPDEVFYEEDQLFVGNGNEWWNARVMVPPHMRSDAEFIAAANPETVTWLINRIAQLEDENIALCALTEERP